MGPSRMAQGQPLVADASSMGHDGSPMCHLCARRGNPMDRRWKALPNKLETTSYHVRHRVRSCSDTTKSCSPVIRDGEGRPP